jgi:hypothetical protein
MTSFQSTDIEPMLFLNSLLIAVFGFTLVLCHDLLAEYRGFKSRFPFDC